MEVIVANDSDFRAEVRSKSLTDGVGYLLATTYPGYRWRVEAQGGVVDIRCEMAGGKYGYTLIPERYFSETQWRGAIIKAGGEILERYHMSRRAFDEAAWLSRPRDFAGLIHPDL